MVTNDDDSFAARRHMMTVVMQETIATLCRNMLSFEVELCVEGLLGITLDKTDVILLNIKEVIPVANLKTLVSDAASQSVNFNDTNCKDHDQDPSAARTLYSKVKCKTRQLNICGATEHLTETSCPAVNDKDASFSQKLHVRETDCISEERHGSDRPEGERTQTCDLESSRACDPKSSRTEDVDVLETESCSEILTRTRKWKEKLDHLNVECAAPPWNNLQIKQENLEDVAETACELPAYGSQDKFELSHQSHNFAPCREQLTSGQSKWLNFSAADPTAFNISDVTDPQNSLYSLGSDNLSGLGHQCTICMMTFTTKHHLKRHINAIHSRSPLLSHCPICRKAFRRRDTMKRHCKSVHYREMGFSALDMMELTGIDTNSSIDSQNHTGGVVVRTVRWSEKADHRLGLEFTND